MVGEGDGSRRLCRTLRSSRTIAISHERRAVSGRQLGQCGKFLHLHNVSPTPTTYLASTNPDICVALSHFILLHLLHTKVVKLIRSHVETFWWKHSGGNILVGKIWWKHSGGKSSLFAARWTREQPPPPGAAYILVSKRMSS